MDNGSVTPGRDRNRGVFLGATNCLEVHMLGDVILVRKSAQVVALPLLKALR